MQYITGDSINHTTIAWATARGAKVEMTLVRNAQLADNGWLPSTSHTIQLTVNGNIESYYGAADDADHGYVVQARMGKALIPVPAAVADQVKALEDERKTHNAAVLRGEVEADAAYEDHAAAVERMRTTGRA